MGPYDELLQTALSLGIRPPDQQQQQQQQRKQQQHADATTGLAQAKQLVEQCSELHALELRVSALSAHLACRTVTDAEQLSARAAGLSSAASTLQLISASKDAIADHLRSASMRPSVPVAPQYQPDFANMLRCAASNTAVLHGGLQVLQWAASLSDKPSCWEDHLQVIRASAQGIKECVTAMREFDQQLSAAAAAAAVGSGVDLGSISSMGVDGHAVELSAAGMAARSSSSSTFG